MKVVQGVFFMWVWVVLSSFGAIQDESIPLSEKQQENLHTVMSVLAAIYENDASLIPADPNAIIALEVSENPRDQLAWELFNIMQRIIDPNSPDDIFEDTSANHSDTTLKAGNVEEAVMKNSLSTKADTGSMRMAAMETIEDLDNPLGSCILMPGTYRILSLPLEIEGHVVMPAGVRLIAPADPNLSVIEVMPGGLLETGRAGFYSDEDYPTVLPPVEIVPEDTNLYFAHNNVGIFVHRGADPKTRIENVVINHCKAGVVIDEQLNHPVRNVITFACYDGIHLYAPAGLIDCEFWMNGSVYDWMIDYIMANLIAYLNGSLHDTLLYYAGVGVYVCLDGESYPCPEAEIQRTTLYNGDVGVYVQAGYSDPNLPDPDQNIPRVNIVNSCLALNYLYGLYQSEGDALMDVQYCAFGSNESHTNVSLPYTGCIELYRNPFYTLGEDKRLYVAGDSAMIDAGYGMAEEGTGTCHLWPDMGVMDIGTHVSLGVTGGFGIASSPADFNWDGVVDAKDLALLEMCMGAVTDPNIVAMDLSYDSRVNLPDFAWFSYDYGYSGDPNESGNNDPNCARSDFDGDGRVDISDLALLAEHWLRAVTDEQRLCSVCNLYSDPNAPAAIDASDMAVFMADWGVQYSSDPNIVVTSGASILSVTVNNPAPAWKISAFLDEEPIGVWEAGSLGSTAFEADLTRYGPGSHRVKVVRNIGYGMEITEQVITDPNSTGLYFADIPDVYEPNEPYCVGGFNLSDELNIKIEDIYEQPVYEVNIPSGVVALEISSEVFDDPFMATFSVSRNTTPAPEDEERYEKLLKRKFDPDTVSEKYVRVILLLPDVKVIKTYKDAIFSVMKASEKRGVRGVVLTGYDVNKDNLDVLFKSTYGRKIVVYFGHANSHIENIQRTRFQCYALSRVYDPGNYYDVGAVSYTKYTNNNAISLPFYTVGKVTRPLDDFAYDMSSIFQRGEAFVDQMYVFGCLSAAYPDMAIAQGCGQEHDQSMHDILYVGFTKAVTQNSYDWIPGFKDLCTLVVQGLTVLFDELGDGKTIQQAIAKVEQQETGIRTALFGTNGRLDNTWGATNRSSEDDDRLTVYGLGYVGGVKFSHYGDNQ